MLFNMCSAPGVLTSWGAFITIFTIFFPLFFVIFYVYFFGAMLEKVKGEEEKEIKLFKTYFITLGGLVLFGFVGAAIIVNSNC